MMSSKLKLINKNILLLLIAATIVIIPLIVNKNAEYGGSDGQGEEMITKINSSYKPWASSLYEPQSGEIETLFFSLQAALGAGVICYYLGYKNGQKINNKENNK